MSDDSGRVTLSDDSIAYGFQWTPSWLNAHINFLHSPETMHEEHFFTVLSGALGLVFLMLIGTVYLFECYGFLDEHFAMAFGGGGLAAVGLLTSGSWWNECRKRRMPNTPYVSLLLNSSAEDITLKSDGVAIVGQCHEMSWDWRAFTRIGEGAEGIVLALSPGHGILVPDDALPEGIDRAEVLRRVKRWKGPW